MNPTIKASPKNVRQSFNQTMLPQSVASPTQETNVPISPTIDASRLTTNSVVVPPPVVSNTAQSNLNSALGTMGQSLELSAKETAKAPAEAPKPTLRDTITDRLSSILNLQSTQGDRTAELQKEQGLFEKQQLVTDLENQYRAKERFYTKEEEKIRKNVEGKTATAIEQDVATLNRQKNSELADIAIQQQAAAGNYRTAFDIVEAKIAAEFEPLQNEIETLKTMYSFYQNDLTESEKLEAQARIQEKEAALNFERNKELKRYEQELQQSDPLYQAQVANIYSQISERSVGDIAASQKEGQRLTNALNQTEVVTKKIVDVLPRISSVSSGITGGVSKYVPGTPAYNLARDIDTIKANIGFQTLQAMREASPTGGALGQVAVQELEMLQATLGSLDVGQGPAQLKENLNNVFTHYRNWANTVGYTVSPTGELIQLIPSE